MIRQLWLLLLCFHFCEISHTVKAQNLYISPENQLDSIRLNSGYNDFISMDSRGLVWISSLNGLSCYNGQKITRQLAVGENIQSGIFEDQLGNFWFSTAQQLCFYERNSDSLHTFQIQASIGDTIKNDYHLFFLEHGQRLWLKAGSSIYTFEPVGQKTVKITDTRGVRFTVDSAANGEVRHIFASLWLNGYGFEKIQLNKGTSPKKQYLFQDDSQNGKITIYQSCLQGDSILWLFSNRGLIAYDIKQQLHQIYILPGNTKNNFAKGIFIDSTQLLVLAADSKTWLFDTRQKKFALDKNPKGWSYNKVRSVSSTNNDHLWLSYDNKNMVKYQWNYRNPFYVHLGDEVFDLAPKVISIAEDRQQNIWCATKSQGLLYKPQNGQWTKLSTTPLLRRPSQDALGQTWAIGGHQIYLLNESAKNWESVLSLPNYQLHFLIHLSPNRKLLSTDKGVFELNGPSHHLQRSKNPVLGKQSSFDIFQLYTDSAQRIYFAEGGQTLTILQIQKDSFKTLYSKTLKAEINCIWEDRPLKRTWLGTSNGLGYYDWQKGYQSFRHPDLEKAIIHALVKDKKDRLWIASDRGLFCLNGDEVLVYRKADGLSTEAFSPYASCYASDGKIWLGSQDGLIVFHPDSIHPYPFRPKINYQTIYVNGQAHDSDYSINEIKSLDLAYDQNSLAFDCRAISYYQSHLNQVYYRLSGHNEQWRSTANGQLIEFPQLPAGQYLLELYGLNANGLKGAARQLRIAIHPPWWQSWWARTLFLIIVAGISYLAFQVYLRRKLREQKRLLERQQALQEERNRIAGELHDDLGAGLSVIRFLSDPGISLKTPLNANKIYQSAGELLEKMSDIIWAMNAENDHLDQLITYLQRYVYEYLDLHQLDFDMKAPEQVPMVLLSGKQRRNILLAVKETLHNVVKHAEASHVQIRISLTADLLRIYIHDNGKGFDTTVTSKHGNGLKNIQKRVQEIGGKVVIRRDEGTGVRLEVPYSSSNI